MPGPVEEEESEKPVSRGISINDLVLSVGESLYSMELVKVKPGQTVYVPNVAFPNRKKIREIKCGIGWVDFTDGQAAFPDENVQYTGWDISRQQRL